VHCCSDAFGIVVSGFPGVGKTIFSTSYSECLLTITDSDSSSFSWCSDGTRNPDFPRNYIAHIKEQVVQSDFVMVSSHRSVRDALRNDGMHYILVYPDRGLKEEYLERYRRRGNERPFIDTMADNWDDFIDEIEQETFPHKVRLGPGVHLGDVSCVEQMLLDAYALGWIWPNSREG
jgi:hypothetical protein